MKIEIDVQIQRLTDVTIHSQIYSKVKYPCGKGMYRSITKRITNEQQRDYMADYKHI